MNIKHLICCRILFKWHKFGKITFISDRIDEINASLSWDKAKVDCCCLKKCQYQKFHIGLRTGKCCNINFYTTINSHCTGIQQKYYFIIAESAPGCTGRPTANFARVICLFARTISYNSS